MQININLLAIILQHQSGKCIDDLPCREKEREREREREREN